MDYLASFPESIFVPKDSYSLSVYEDRILAGEKIMKESSVAICGLARDVEKVLPYTIARIEYLASLFKSAQIIIVENDSKDDTKRLLQEWEAQNNLVHLISDDYDVPYLTDKSLQRREIMAFQRNKYLDKVQELCELYQNEPDYLVVLDSDLYGGLSYNGFKNSMGQTQPWICMSSNSIIYRDVGGKVEKLWYDTWAFSPYGSFDDICGENGNRMSFSVGEECVPVSSNFGGCAIYRYSPMKHLRYDSSDCDHKSLNFQIVKQDLGNIFLNPSMVILQSPTSITFRLAK